MNEQLEALQATLEEVRAGRNTETDELIKRRDDANSRLNRALKASKDAIVSVDLNEYAKAKENVEEIQTELDMLNARLDQLSSEGYMSEATSDAFFDSVLEAEAAISEEYRADILRVAKTLKELTERYRENIADAERIMNTWHNDVYPNYRTFGQTYRIDPVTGQYTDRAEAPRPVHPMGYYGIKEANAAERFIEDMEG